MTPDMGTILLLAFIAHCVFVYAVLKLALTGRGVWFKRQGEDPEKAGRPE